MSDLEYEFVCDHDPCVCDDALKGVYRIEPHAGEDWQDFRGIIQIMLRDGGLVVDETIQAIVEAWKEVGIFGINHPASERIWNKLAAMLDALTEEGNDDAT